MVSNSVEKKISKLLPKFFKGFLWSQRGEIMLNFLFQVLYGIEAYPNIPGFLHPIERRLLFQLAKDLPKGSHIIEIGTYGGLSTYFLGHGALRSNSSVVSIDPFETSMKRQIEEWDSAIYLDHEHRNSKPSYNEVMDTMHNYDLSDVVKLVVGFSQDIIINNTSDILDEDQSIDLLVIDGNHKYTAVVSDITSYSKYMHSGSIIACHDASASAEKWQGCVNAAKEVIRLPEWKDIRTQHTILYAVKN